MPALLDNDVTTTTAETFIGGKPYTSDAANLIGANRNYWEPATVRIVEWDGTMLRIRQRLMTVGQPYTFVLEGVPVVAIKRTSGDVDFYEVPQR